MQTTLAPTDTCQISLFAIEGPESHSTLEPEPADLAEGHSSFAVQDDDVRAVDDIVAVAGRSGEGEVQALPLDSIDPTPRPWHLHRDPASADVDDILDAIRTTGTVNPIRVVRSGDRHVIVSGLRRYHAAMRRRAEGGPDRIAAIIMTEDDPAGLLRWTLLAELTRRSPSYLEIGWALVRLCRILEESSGETVTNKALMVHLGLRPKSWKSRISEYLATATAMPESAAESAAERHGCRLGDLSKQPRATLRHIRTAGSDAHTVLLDVLAESVASGGSAGALVRSARATVKDVNLLRQAAAAVAAGKSASSVLPAPKATAQAKVSATFAQRLRTATSRCRSWVRVVVESIVTRARGIREAVRRRMK